MFKAEWEKISYEWDFESYEVDKDGGILIYDGEQVISDHEYCDKLSQFIRPLKENEKILLCRNDPLGDRTWAYVEGGKFVDDSFTDWSGARCTKIPKKYIAELQKYMLTA